MARHPSPSSSRFDMICHVDALLCEKLLETAHRDSTIRITHILLAAELGSVHKAISGQLSELQRRNRMAQSRRVVEPLDASARELVART